MTLKQFLLIFVVSLGIISALSLIYLSRLSVDPIVKAHNYIPALQIDALQGMVITKDTIRFANHPVFKTGTYQIKYETVDIQFTQGDNYIVKIIKKVKIENPDDLSDQLRLYLREDGAVLQEVFYPGNPLLPRHG